MKTVLLYGFLGAQFGRVHRYDVKSPAEAVRALCATLDGFRQALARGGFYRVLVGGVRDLDKRILADPISDRETIRIVPVVLGSGPAARIIIGAALIYFSGGLAAGFGATAATATTAASAGFMGVTAGTFSAIGVSLVIGGVSQMLFSPKQNQNTSVDRPENTPSFSFDGPVNTVAQGNPIPLFYGGPLRIGSQVGSAGLTVEQIA